MNWTSQEIQKMASVGPLEPWDLHYLREIDDSGFIDALYST